MLQDDHVERAVRMAIAMRDRFDVLAAGWSKRGYSSASGWASRPATSTLGRIGFEGRYDYGMVGNAVIAAARLSAAAAAGQILLSPRSHAEVENLVDVEPVGEINLKGFSRPIAPVNVLGMRDTDAPAETPAEATRPVGA